MRPGTYVYILSECHFFLELFKYSPKMWASADSKPWVDGTAHTYAYLVPRHSFTVAPLSLATIQEQGPLIPFQIFTASGSASLSFSLTLFFLNQSHKCILHSLKPNNIHLIQTGSDFTIIAFFFRPITVLNYCSLQHQQCCKIFRDKTLLPTTASCFIVSGNFNSFHFCVTVTPTSIFSSLWCPEVQS